MSSPAGAVAEWAHVVGVPRDPGLVMVTETVTGRLVLQEHTAAGMDSLFGRREFEVVEVAETAILEPQVRVYEELVIRVQRNERDEVVSAVLRREQAEVTITGKVDGTTAGFSGLEARADERLATGLSKVGTDG